MQESVNILKTDSGTLLADLLESDASYFEAAAIVEKIEGASIARMAGLESLSAGAVVQRIEAKELPDNINGWIADIEHKFAAYGISQLRFYLQYPIPRLEMALNMDGYRSRIEHAVILFTNVDNRSSEEVTLKPCLSAADWTEKLAIHDSWEQAPDGHPAVAESWVSMERQKCDTGYMHPYLIYLHGEAVGAANAAPQGSLLRLKNLVVANNSCRKRIGSNTIGLFAHLAADAGKGAVGAFVLDDEPFLRMYTQRGYQIAGQQTEWVKSLR